MRVVLLTAGNSWSGVEVHTVGFARALREAGHEVAIAELGRELYSKARQPLPCPVVHLPLGPGVSGKIPLESLGFRAWKQVLSSLHADVAILVKGTFHFGGLALEAAARLRFPCFIVIEHYHEPLGERPPGLGLWWYRQKLAGYLRSLFPHKVVCVSKALASTLRNDYGYRASKLVVVHSGVDTNVFAPSPLARGKAREIWGIPEHALVFGTLGRLSPMKNHGQLLNAFSRLCESGGKADPRLVIVGEGPLRAALESQASAKGVRQRVVFAGFAAEPQLACPGFDVFCFPSTTGESLGIALLEAMSCGCPPIGSATGGVPEILDDSSIGWLIPPGDENGLLSAMRDAASLDQEALQRKGAQARARVVRDFHAADRWAEWVAAVEAACGDASC